MQCVASHCGAIGVKILSFERGMDSKIGLCSDRLVFVVAVAVLVSIWCQKEPN